MAGKYGVVVVLVVEEMKCEEGEERVTLFSDVLSLWLFDYGQALTVHKSQGSTDLCSCGRMTKTPNLEDTLAFKKLLWPKPEIHVTAGGLVVVEQLIVTNTKPFS